ncbi:MAG: response regulator, partial [Bacteriovoracaceae bacterium]|nr:response regulator [Bacteriovoracaceae bacterium]
MTAKKLSEEDLKAFDDIFEPLLVINKKEEMIYFNHSLLTLSKSPPRILKKIKNIKELFKSSEIKISALISDAIKNNQMVLSTEGDIEFLQAEGARYTVVIKVFPIGSEHFVVCLHDLSVEKRLFDKYKEQFEELKSTHSQVVQADKLATLGELTAGISHEINNPLTIASGNAEIIQMLLENKDINQIKEKLKSSVNDVKESLERIHVIVNNMRNFLHKSEDKKEYCELSLIIENTLMMVSPSFNTHQVVIEKNLGPENLVALVNKVKIEQVLINLCKNALDAINSSGTRNGKVTISLCKDTDQNFVNIKVSDNGPGIKEEIREDIFSPFFTTKEVGEGTGLGLSISKKIVESHQGQILLDSKVGKGTTFTIKLPSIEVSSYSQSEYLKQQNRSINGKRILVVDNEVQILNIMNKFIEDEGHIFIGSTNGNEALRFLDNLNIDLIITDYSMPQMNGTEFITKVRDLGIKCPVYYLTSKNNIENFNQDKD